MAHLTLEQFRLLKFETCGRHVIFGVGAKREQVLVPKGSALDISSLSPELQMYLAAKKAAYDQEQAAKEQVAAKKKAPVKKAE